MSPFSKFQSHDESYGFVFWQTYMLWSRKIKRALKPFQLTHTQFVILSVVAYVQQSQPVASQADVSHLSKIDKMTISTSVKTLRKNGYLSLQRHAEDARVNGLVLSEAGKAIQQQALAAIEAVDEQFFTKAIHSTDTFIHTLHMLQQANEQDE